MTLALHETGFAKSLRGYKTYVMCALMVLTGIYTFITGDTVATFDNPTPVPPQEAFWQVLEGFGLGFLRSGVKTTVGR